MPLNVKKVNKLSKPGRYSDGKGLYAQLTTTGRSWVFRFELRGRERWMGLGALCDFSLDEARERARKARQLLKDGHDPLDARQAERAERALEAAKRIDFETAARDYFKGHEQKWSNAEHRRQFLSSLQDFAFPLIGKMPVAMVDTSTVLEVLKPIWHTMTVTAGRVRNRIEAVLDWATASGYRAGPNPAAWSGHLEAILPPKAKIAKVKHHAAMSYGEVAGFVGALASRDGIEAKALEFLIITAARTGEVIKARRSEIDFDKKVWTVPAERMKARKEHRVPLSDPAIAILKALPTEDYLFPGARKGGALGKMAMANLVAAMGHDVTVHGFRSSFRDWAAEQSAFPREIIEQCLAHSVGNAVEQAYRRSDVLEKRRKLMAEWARYCGSPPVKKSAQVVPLRGRQ